LIFLPIPNYLFLANQNTWNNPVGTRIVWKSELLICVTMFQIFSKVIVDITVLVNDVTVNNGTEKINTCSTGSICRALFI